MPETGPESVFASPHRRPNRTVVVVGILVCALLCVPLTVAAYSVSKMRIDPPAGDELTAALSPRGLLEPTNVLIAGVDRTVRGRTRADTVMLLRIAPLQRRIWLLSLPRDTNIGLKSETCSPAPAAQSALRQATLKQPGRRTASDGICASDAHNAQNPLSDHRWGNAFDLTHDPARGTDCGYIAERIRRSRDPRVKYAIFDGRYFSAESGWQWRDYRGTEPHDTHLHVSIHDSHRNDTSPWPGVMHEVDINRVEDLESRLLSMLFRRPDASEHRLMRSFAEIPTAKLNGAYSRGGAPLLVDAVERLTSVPMHHYVEIDFRGLSAMVDALGGVTIDVPSEIDDREAASASPGRRAHYIAAGRQRLDGEHALTFIRSRQYRDADFGRVRNQQLFMKALARTLMSPRGLSRLPAAVATAGDHVRTDMDPGTLLRLATGVMVANPMDISSATLTGEWRSPVVVVDPERKEDLLTAMERGDRFLPAPADISVTVLNGTGEPGAANRLAYLLARRGFGVSAIGNTASGDYEHTTILVPSDKEDVGLRLQQSLPDARVSHGPDPHKVPTDALIIIGRD